MVNHQQQRGVPYGCYATAAVGAAACVFILLKTRKRRLQASCPESNNPVVASHVLKVVSRIERAEHRDPFAVEVNNNNNNSNKDSSKSSATERRRRLRPTSSSSSSSPIVDFPLPAPLVDMAAFRSNVITMAKIVLASGKRIRLGTKSFRVPALIELAADIIEQEARKEFKEHLVHDMAAAHHNANHHHRGGGDGGGASMAGFVHVDELDDAAGGAHLASPMSARRFSAVSGLMTFTAAETFYWAKRGTFDSLLLAYPIADTHSAHVFLSALLLNPTQRVTCSVVVDCVEQVTLLADAAIDAIRHERYLTTEGFDGANTFIVIHVMIDVDMSYRAPLFGGAIHLGVRRSPLRTPKDVYALLEDIEGINQKCYATMRHEKVGIRFVVDGMMGYEAQVAGLPDAPFGAASLATRAVTALIQKFKSVSMQDVCARRQACVAAIQSIVGQPAGNINNRTSLLCVNGGGSGSLSATAKDPCVTEITIGSGALCGHIFDRIGSCAHLKLKPALFIALGVARIAAKEEEGSMIAVCNGGGWIASGPCQADRAPIIVYPPSGIETLPMEGFGEVQTPFLVRGKPVSVGDVVLIRPAKSGEIAEHFDEYLLVDDNEAAHVQRVPTYRGIGGWTA